MFNNTNVRFSNTAQVMRTVEYLKENKTTKYVQYTPALKVKVIDLMLEEKQLAEQGKDTFINKSLRASTFGKFSKAKFYQACGLGTVPISGRWEEIYNKLDGDSRINPNVCSVSRHALGKLQQSAESKGLGDLARETNALMRKTKELNLKHDAEQMGFKLVKVV
jgi:hypothetical protein